MMTDPKNEMLDDLFAQARSVQPTPSDALTARVLADADAVQPKMTASSRPKAPLWAQMMDAIGGWPAVSGLAAATVAGIWIGVSPPSTVSDLTASWIGDEVSVELFPTDLAFVAGDFVDG